MFKTTSTATEVGLLPLTYLEAAIKMVKADLDAFLLNLSYRYNKSISLFTYWTLNILNGFKSFQTNFINNSFYIYHNFSTKIRNKNNRDKTIAGFLFCR